MPHRPSESRPVPVPRHRVTRAARLGGMTAGIAGDVLVNGARSLMGGAPPRMRDLLLTPRNVSRLANELARMRGAAMKLGQLISMDTGDVLPPELSEIMARLRADADFMPPKQLKTVLTQAWGPRWLSRFQRFDVRPIAAASIGQVHRAQTRDGRTLAIKVQYPGIRESVDSDVRNVGALIAMSGLLPKGLALEPLLLEARKQLREEADYLAEADRLTRYGAALGDDPAFCLPEVQSDLTCDTILAMSFVEGGPIEAVADLAQADRDRVATHLIDLTFRELFDFGFMQTDPNFANYRYEAASGRIVLLDFGAAREVPCALARAYGGLLRAGMDGDRAALTAHAAEIGFFAADTPAAFRDGVIDMMELAFDGLVAQGGFDFADPTMMRALHAAGEAMHDQHDIAHVPPIDALFLQRKFAGIYLLAARLGARVDVRGLLEPYLSRQTGVLAAE